MSGGGESVDVEGAEAQPAVVKGSVESGVARRLGISEAEARRRIRGSWWMRLVAWLGNRGVVR